MTLAGVAFFVSLFGLIALFTLKSWEEKRGSVLFPHFREKADTYAVGLKIFLRYLLKMVAQLPRIVLFLARAGLHMIAILFGHLAHWIGEKSHALADFVSHKHRFERREPRSEFLKQVTDRSIPNRPPPSSEPKATSSFVPETEVGVEEPLVQEEAAFRNPVAEELVSVESPVEKKKAPKKRRVFSRKKKAEKLETEANNGQNS